MTSHLCENTPLCKNTPLCILAYKYKSDKTNLYKKDNPTQHCHNYTPHYYEILKDRKNNAKNILEIGIGFVDKATMRHMKKFNYEPGASLKMWRDFFSNAQIYGIDISEKALIQENRITTYQCDQVDNKRIEKLFNGKKFDLIIDDGSHQQIHQLKSLKIFLDYLNDDGIYIIEDVKNEIFDPKFVTTILGNSEILNKINIKKYDFRRDDNQDDFFYLITKINQKK